MAALSPRRLTTTAPLAALACLLFALVGATAARGETVSFGFTGSEQTLPIPAGITSVHVVAVGGRGGTGAGDVAAGGFGARVSADLVVTPGQILFIEVGGNGGNGAGLIGGSGGFNGGGESLTGEGAGSAGGGGGGASDLRLVSRAQAGTLTSRLLVAGGGGGSGGSGFGAAGAAAGQDAAAGGGSAGGGGGTHGTAAAGGNGQLYAGTNGSSGTGGIGGYSESKEGGGGGGGGGGGVFGGGGGGGGHSIASGGGGGGGGSSSGGAVTLDTTGVPLVTISYETSGAGGSAGPLNTTIDAHPAKLVETRKAKARVKFRFSANLLGASFRCKMDDTAWAPCSSPKRYGVFPGKHTFKVKAVGDSTPASFGFKVKRKF